jgi:hypothetical protein
MEKVISITTNKSKNNDYLFWMSKSPSERIEAIEILRQQYYSLNKNVQQGFQRVLTITDKKRS